MFSRLAFIPILLFWLTMNVLLWRAEMGSREAENSEVPAELVWRKVLTSPDSSSLQVLHHGKNIGFCHWTTSVGEEWATVTAENIPPGMPGKNRRYSLRLEGSALEPEMTNRIRFEGNLKVGANHAWQELDARFSVRPLTWQVHAAAAQQTVELTAQDGETQWKRAFRFSDLEAPGAIATELVGPYAGELLAETGWPSSSAAATSLSLGMKWEAREDSFWIGHALVRAYRLQARLLDRYRIVILVSRVGEILRVELPDELVLVNDQLTVM